MAGRTGRGAVADLSAHMGELQMADGGDMLLDECDPVDESLADQKTDVAIITPDDTVDRAPDEAVDDDDSDPLADDCTFSTHHAGAC